MFERFTESARRAVVLAQAEARAARQTRVGIEQMLIGVVTAEHSSACSVLATLQIDADRLREVVTAEFGQGDTDKTAHIPFSDDAKMALQNAFHESRNRDHTYIGTEHLLIAVLKADGIGDVFGALGIPPDRVREATIARLDSEEGGEPAEP